MSALARIAEQPASVPQPLKRQKKKRIAKTTVEAIRLLLSGECKTQKIAAERVGITPQWLSMQLNKPEIQAFAATECRRNLTQGTLRASARILELVDASSEHVSLDAAKHVLAIEGIRPPDNSQPLVNIAITPGYVVDLSGSSLIGHERQTEAKPLIEHKVGSDGE